jgi:aminopeptidase N
MCAHNDISYTKSAGILKHLENLVGADIFRLSVKNYLEKYSFKFANA